MRITDWAVAERPREKLTTLGADALSDAELLAIFLRTGVSGLNAVELARYLLNEFGSLRQLLNATEQEFCRAKGLGKAKYTLLKATLEMANRYFAEPLNRIDVFESTAQTRTYLLAKLRDKAHEEFVMLCLDAQHRLISYRSLFSGTINAANVYPREIVKQALADQAVAVILAHNHPSGVAEPSQADRRITEKIQQAMALMDIRVLDHIVVGDGCTISFAERGWL